MGCRQCLPLSVVQLKGKHYRKPHCCNGVVDMLGLCPSSKVSMGFLCLQPGLHESHFFKGCLVFTKIIWYHLNGGCLLKKKCDSRNISRRVPINVSSVVWILKMVGPKMQDFCPKINMLKGFFLKQSYYELLFVKKSWNCTFKVNFLCQKSTESFQKRNHLRISI